MVAVYVPGVAQTVLKGQIGAQPWAVVHHWKVGSSTSPWVQSDADLLAHTALTQWGTQMAPQTCNNVFANQCVVTDLSSSTGVGSVYNHANIPGTSSNILEPSSLATVIQNTIAARYRGGKPRTFWPGLGLPSMTNESTWNAALLSSFVGTYIAWIQAVETASYSFGTSSLTFVVPRYTYTYTDDPVHHKYRHTRSGLAGVFLVLTPVGQAKVGSQRKRLTV